MRECTLARSPAICYAKSARIGVVATTCIGRRRHCRWWRIRSAARGHLHRHLPRHGGGEGEGGASRIGVRTLAGGMSGYAVPPRRPFRRAERRIMASSARARTEVLTMNGSMTTPVFGSYSAAAAFWAVASSWLVEGAILAGRGLADDAHLDPSGLVTIPVASSTVPLSGFLAVLFSPPLLAPLALRRPAWCPPHLRVIAGRALSGCRR